MKFEQVERKVKNPPAAQNVARLLDPQSEIKTTENIAKFAVSIPAFNYLPGQTVIRDRVALGLELATAVATVQKAGAPAGRLHNETFVRAFYQYDGTRRYSASRMLDSYKGQFKISREIAVPTHPTFTILENAKQIPVVICGWKSFGLEPDQVRAWLSMLESGLFSFADYSGSPWEVVILSERETGTGLMRMPTVIKAGDYQLFSAADLRELAAMYARALKAAMPLARALWEKREEARKDRQGDDTRRDSPHQSEDRQIEMFADTKRG